MDAQPTQCYWELEINQGIVFNPGHHAQADLEDTFADALSPLFTEHCSFMVKTVVLLTRNTRNSILFLVLSPLSHESKYLTRAIYVSLLNNTKSF